MHESTHRLLCRLTFIVVCVLPTALVAGWLWARDTTVVRVSQKANWETRLAEQLGFRVTIKQFASPHPHEFQLEGVAVTDPETGEAVADIPLIQVIRHGTTTTASISHPRIQTRYLRRSWHNFRDRVLQQPADLPVTVRLAGTYVTLVGEQSEQTFIVDSGLVQSSPDQTSATFDFRLAGRSDTEPTRFVASRQRSTGGVTSIWNLRVPAEMPCEIFVDHLPSLSHLGRDCTFRGLVEVEDDGGGWTGRVAGEFRDVDLGLLVRSHHKLSGMANVTFNHLTYRNGRLADAAGSVVTSSGAIGQTLLRGAAEHLQMSVPPGVERLANPIHHYSRMSFGFELAGVGLSITGTCDYGDGSRGVVIESSSGPLLTDGTAKRVEVVKLAELLSRESMVKVSVTAETLPLLNALLPPPAVPSAEPGELPHAAVRMGD